MMQPDIFSADLSNLTKMDVSEFLGLQKSEVLRHPEGPTIDYKEHLPSNIGEDVAAMSNTFGGLIFIGVKADKAKQNIPVAMDGDKLGSDAKARISEIEDVFRQRQSLSYPASQLRESLSGIESMKHTYQDSTGQVYDIDYQSIFLIPRT